jgi:hypothetical protein
MKPDDLQLNMEQKILLRAAELVRQGHTKGRLAATALGKACWPQDSGATQWCMTGAVWRAEADYGYPLDMGVTALLSSVGRRRPPPGFISWPFWNNAEERTAEQVAQKLEELAFL